MSLKRPSAALVLALLAAPTAGTDKADGESRKWPPSLPLALAGHTHGGQVRLPGLPPAWLPSGNGRYVAGWYARGEARLYVSRGVGTSTLPVRSC